MTDVNTRCSAPKSDVRELRQVALYRMLGAISRTMAYACATSVVVVLVMLLLGGYVIPHSSIGAWWCASPSDCLAFRPSLSPRLPMPPAVWSHPLRAPLLSIASAFNLALCCH